MKNFVLIFIPIILSACASEPYVNNIAKKVDVGVSQVEPVRSDYLVKESDSIDLNSLFDQDFSAVQMKFHSEIETAKQESIIALKEWQENYLEKVTKLALKRDKNNERRWSLSLVGGTFQQVNTAEQKLVSQRNAENRKLDKKIKELIENYESEEQKAILKFADEQMNKVFTINKELSVSLSNLIEVYERNCQVVEGLQWDHENNKCA